MNNVPDNAGDKTLALGDCLNKVVAVTRASPHVHVPHDTLSEAVRRVTGEEEFSQVTYHRPPRDVRGKSMLAHLVQRTVMGTGAGRVLVADWNVAAGREVADFLKGWPSLRQRVEVEYSVMPRRRRQVLAPMVITDGMNAWSDSFSLRGMINRYFGYGSYHLMMLPGGPTGLGVQSPKTQHLKSQLQAIEKAGSLDGILILQAFPQDCREEPMTPKNSLIITELRRSYSEIRALVGNHAVLAAGVLVDELGKPMGIDRSPLVF